MNRSKKEWLKEQIDKLDTNEHSQIFSIIKNFTSTYTTTESGILVSSENLSKECLDEVERYVLFCIDQHKRMVDDEKTRQSFEKISGV
jgi:hypothetical protein